MPTGRRLGERQEGATLADLDNWRRPRQAHFFGAPLERNRQFYAFSMRWPDPTPQLLPGSRMRRHRNDVCIPSAPASVQECER